MSIEPKRLEQIRKWAEEPRTITWLRAALVDVLKHLDEQERYWKNQQDLCCIIVGPECRDLLARIQKALEPAVPHG